MKKRKGWLLFYLLTMVTVISAAYWGSRTVTVLAENTPPERDHCIIIDPGHGGEDGGAVSCTGMPESTYNLDISLRLNDLFHLLGYETKMTRATDVSIYTKGGSLAQKKASDLKERVRIVQETDNALLLSIHQNNFQDARYSGAQVFYRGSEESQVLAKQMQTAFISTLNPGSSRKCKKSDGVYLMEHVDCDAVLVECGFLSNPEEEAKLKSKEYQNKVCCVIASSVSQFLSNT